MIGQNNINVKVDTELSDTSLNAVANKIIKTALDSKAPAYTYGTTDLVAGTSTLETGVLYFVYEE